MIAATGCVPLTETGCLEAQDQELSLVDLYLREQARLSAVERFSLTHAEKEQPLQARYYSSLLPATPLRAGEQLAFEVDLDACSGCKSCVTACHALNGLDDHETWRDVGLLHGGSSERPVLQHVTSACHHCLDPACLNVCPVRAYEKDAVTGIVRHLDDQCFGCQYCILACPYNVPKYNKQKGIVRKCDMCSARLEAGEAPACVQACPNQAIRIRAVRQQDVLADCETHAFLPGAPDPQYTLPTTNYRTKHVFPRNMLPADYYSVQPEHAHLPLIVMLVLTQLSVGAFLIDFLLQVYAPGELLARIRPAQALSALTFGLLALGASTLHLGRPQYAFRAVLGLRSSWLSREIAAFGLFACLAAVYALSIALPDDWLPAAVAGSRHALQSTLATCVLLTGLCGIVCSIMIYQCTRRPFWNGTSTTLKFLLTTLWLGLATALLTTTAGALWSSSQEGSGALPVVAGTLSRAMLLVASLKLLFEASLFAHVWQKQTTPLERSALLMIGELAGTTQARFGCGVVGGLALPLTLMATVQSPADAASSITGTDAGLCTLLAAAIFVASVGGELLERYLFFTAAVAPKMPGTLR